MPLIAILVTIAGLLPFVILAFAAVGANPEPATRMMGALLDYAALVLAFSGGSYWAAALLTPQPVIDVSPQSRRWRLMFGAVPLVLAWVGLMLSQWLAAWIGLLVLIVGYIVTVVTEHQSGLLAAMPARYTWLRWGFTAVAVAMLTTVLVLRLFGQTIVF